MGQQQEGWCRINRSITHHFGIGADNFSAPRFRLAWIETVFMARELTGSPALKAREVDSPKQISARPNLSRLTDIVSEITLGRSGSMSLWRRPLAGDFAFCIRSHSKSRAGRQRYQAISHAQEAVAAWRAQ
jgi:hypothetical protein